MNKKKSPVKTAEKLDLIFTSKEEEQVQNSLNDLCSTLSQATGPFRSAAISQTGPLYANLRWYLITNNRQLCSQMYVEHGIVQTLIDQPVDDAFRAGFEIKTSQLDPEEIEELEHYLEEFDVIRSLAQGAKWARLFGGGGVLIITPQDPSTPLELEAIDETTPVEYKAFVVWEMLPNFIKKQGGVNPGNPEADGEMYNYYGNLVHPSRVLRIEGKEAPSLTKPRLRGWGMSELERLIRSMNQYLKNQDVVYELIDEAKIDVFRMKGYNTTLLNKDGTRKISERIQSANVIKNYNNAITMDVDDEYEQKQMTFAGLSEILTQIRQGIACDVKMPLTKLFGISAAGFNSGEDDIENYNSMVDGEVRAKVKYKAIFLMKIACQKKFGFIPDDLDLTWKSLRVLSAKDEEDVKEKKFNRVMTAWQNGISDDEEVKEQINKASLLPTEIDPKGKIGDPRGEMMLPPMKDVTPAKSKQIKK